MSESAAASVDGPRALPLLLSCKDMGLILGYWGSTPLPVPLLSEEEQEISLEQARNLIKRFGSNCGVARLRSSRNNPSREAKLASAARSN